MSWLGWLGLMALCLIAGFAGYETVLHHWGAGWADEPNQTPSASQMAPEEVQAILFGVSWCPYCKQAQPIWQSFTDTYDGCVVGGKTVHVRYVDAEKEKAESKLYKISAYPTVKLVRKDKVFTLLKPPTAPNLKAFLEQTTAY